MRMVPDVLLRDGVRDLLKMSVMTLLLGDVDKLNELNDEQGDVEVNLCDLL